MKSVDTPEGPIWVPDTDEHFAGLGEKLPDYQHKVYDAALPYVRKGDIAVDGGAHIGLFSRRMARDFARVVSVEPVHENYRCLKANAPTALAYPLALGETFGSVLMVNPAPTNSGAWEAESGGEVAMRPLDAIVKPGSVGLIKLDCQGYELRALLGAVGIILHDRPVLIVETQCNEKRDEAPERFLKTFGYQLVIRHNKDDVFVWK
jgi:FkbM family methyltransferase